MYAWKGDRKKTRIAISYKNLKYQKLLLSTACKAGFKGPNSLQKCSTNCGVPERCDKGTGKCKGGCQTGWKKHTCIESM